MRVERSRTALHAFRRELEAWLERRRRLDPLRQHHTQLSTLERVLSRGADAVAHALDGIDTFADVGSVYGSCSQLETGLRWIRRVWSFYRDRFDQREDPSTRPLLEAADEVVWSCWAGALRRSRDPGPNSRLPSAPLPYVDDVHAPEARIRDEPPPSLLLPRGAGAETRAALDDFLRELPVPMVGLPAECVSAPWWIVHVGHEVGHHVLVDVDADGRTDAAVSRRVRDAVETAADADDGDAPRRWSIWAEEVFADAYGACCVGAAALGAIAELETHETKEMLRPNPRYPAPVARLALLRRVVERLDLDPAEGAPWLDEFRPLDGPAIVEDGVDVTARAAADHALVPVVADVVLGSPRDGLPPLPDLTDWSAPDFRRTVRHWVDGLRGRTGLYPDESLPGARRMSAATFFAWKEVCGLADRTERREEAARLSEAALEAMAACREQGTRAGSREAEADVERLGDRLAELALEVLPGREGG